MIARASQRVAVRVAHAPAPLGTLGRVALKTCLGVICVASPELVLDRANDYIVYAVDPEESHRAAQRSPTHRAPDAARAAPHASPSRRSGTPHVLVGKGFLSGALEEPGDGTSYVTGRVRTEPRHTYSAFSSDEDEEGDDASNDVLEVVLRMKEAPQQSREHLATLMQGLGEARHTPPARAASTSAPAPAPTPAPAPAAPSSPTAEQRQLMSMLHVIAGALPDQKTRAPPPSAPSAPTSGRADRICYNCGTTTSKTWRMLQLPAGEPVPHPAAERPPADAVPLTWTPKYARATQCVADGETRWQACNACGLYFTKYNTSRSERMCAGARADKRRDARAPKRIKTEETGSGKPLRAPPAAQHTRALQDLSGNVSPVRRTASSPVRSQRMPPPAASPRTARNVRAVTPGQYGVPSYLIHSSPNTAMHRLLSETEHDLDEMHAHGDLPTPGKLLALRAAQTSPSPVRRSPRKQPHGTRGAVNPYATHASGTTPLFAHATPSSPALPLDEHAEGPPSPSAERASRAERRAPRASPAAPVRPAHDDVFGAHAWLHTHAAPTLAPAPAADTAPAPSPAPPTVAPAAVSSAPTPSTPPRVPARRPLPATVEDASSSQHSSPRNSPESAVEYIEDPYGLLQASGLAVYDDEGNMSLGEGLDLGALNGIELHGAEAFGEHLRDFTAHGGLGLAAHLGQAHTPHVESFTSQAPHDAGLVAMLDDPGVLALLANCHSNAATPSDAGAAPVAST